MNAAVDARKYWRRSVGCFFILFICYVILQLTDNLTVKHFLLGCIIASLFFQLWYVSKAILMEELRND